MKILQILVFVCLLAGLVLGQSSNKVFTLSGNVYDVNQAVVPEVSILIKDADEKTFKTQTNETGKYEIVLPLGSYTIEFSQIGFKKFRASNLIVNSETKKTLNVTLDVGRCEDCNGAIYGERWDNFTVLSGYIYDSSGAIINNAEITFRDFDGKVKVKIIKTNSQGWFNTTMPNGIYSILVKSIGFKDFKIDRYLATGTKKGLNLDIVLEFKGCDDPTINCSFVISDPIKKQLNL